MKNMTKCFNSPVSVKNQWGTKVHKIEQLREKLSPSPSVQKVSIFNKKSLSISNLNINKNDSYASSESALKVASKWDQSLLREAENRYRSVRNSMLNDSQLSQNSIDRIRKSFASFQNKTNLTMKPSLYKMQGFDQKKNFTLPKHIKSKQ